MRSKALILANIFATLLTLLMVLTTLAAINEIGGFGALAYYSKEAEAHGLTGFENWYFLGYGPYLLITQAIIYIVATAIGWVSLCKKNSKSAFVAAILYWIGTVCYIIFIIESIPVIVFGLIGAFNQKKLNNGKTEKPKKVPMSRLY